MKLAWSVRESARCLVDELDRVLNRVALLNKDVRIGKRLDYRELINGEMEAGCEKVGVVVSGPDGFVTRLGTLLLRERLGRRGLSMRWKIILVDLISLKERKAYAVLLNIWSYITYKLVSTFR